MEEITIKYWSPHGRQEETKFQCGHTKIDFVMRAAQRVDLSNLARCSNLQKLDLSHNMLEKLDLSPISHCIEIEEINLQSNRLTKLNLWPLIENTKLESIDMSENRLHDLDLTPVIQHARIRMDSSVVVSVDSILKYVYSNEELTKRFQVLRTDGVSWEIPPVIMWNMYSDLAKQYDWAQVKVRIISILQKMDSIDWYSAQRGLLEGLDLASLAGFVGDPLLLLDNAVAKMSYEEARQTIFDTAVELVHTQLDEGGPTLYLDVEGMKDTGASKLIPLIVERRKEEIENLVLFTKGSRVDLKPLWLTHYGFHILSATDMGFITNLEGLHLLRKSFAELDMELVTENIASLEGFNGGDYSQGMEKHVFSIIEFKQQFKQLISRLDE